MRLPQIYSYVGNRLTQMNSSSATAFRTVVLEIFAEVFRVYQANPGLFAVHPGGSPAPTNRSTFRAMFEEQINDANTASVLSGAKGIPIKSAERRVGKEWVSTCRSRWSPEH